LLEPANNIRPHQPFSLGFWIENRLRTTTAIGRPDVNLDFYPDILGQELSGEVNLVGWAFYSVCVGGGYTFMLA
jgi:hypothetical protein